MATGTPPQVWTVRMTLYYRRQDGVSTVRIVTGTARGSEAALRAFFPRKLAAIKAAMPEATQWLDETVSYQLQGEPRAAGWRSFP
jgi:hypothetical protein